jgi:hypothetical protein
MVVWLATLLVGILTHTCLPRKPFDENTILFCSDQSSSWSRSIVFLTYVDVYIQYLDTKKSLLSRGELLNRFLTCNFKT